MSLPLLQSFSPSPHSILIMNYSLETIDILVLIVYGCCLLGMGLYFNKKTKTARQFMVADNTIPGWAAGIAVMSAYTSSISYIATPGEIL